jgi:hypothetical protein
LHLTILFEPYFTIQFHLTEPLAPRKFRNQFVVHFCISFTKDDLPTANNSAIPVGSPGQLSVPAWALFTNILHCRMHQDVATRLCLKTSTIGEGNKGKVIHVLVFIGADTTSDDHGTF